MQPYRLLWVAVALTVALSLVKVGGMEVSWWVVAMPLLAPVAVVVFLLGGLVFLWFLAALKERVLRNAIAKRRKW